jgi:hypothetical protein
MRDLELLPSLLTCSLLITGTQRATFPQFSKVVNGARDASSDLHCMSNCILSNCILSNWENVA